MLRFAWGNPESPWVKGDGKAQSDNRPSTGKPQLDLLVACGQSGLKTVCIAVNGAKGVMGEGVPACAVE